MQSNESFKIKIIKNTDKDFYKIIGKFLSKRKIVKELGFNIWDDDNKIWLIAIKENKIGNCIYRNVLGFCAYKIKNNKYELTSDFVLHEHRNKNIYNKLFIERIKLIGNNICIAHATEKSLNTFLRHEFKIQKKIGRYIIVRLN